MAEVPTELATKIAAPVSQENKTSKGELDTKPVFNSPQTAQAKTDYAPESSKPDSRKSLLVIAVTVFALGFIGVAIWFALSRPSQGTVTSSNGSSDASQANNKTAAITNPRATDNPVKVDGSNKVYPEDAAKEPPREPRGELRAALNDWVTATNSRDINKQMTFYAPTLNAFYRKRNVPQSAVRAEKSQMSSQSGSIEVRASEPEIQLGTDGQTATMRFHKSWNFSGTRSESGEVIQELRWQKTGSGWKIVSERDVEVIRITR
jgi:ketosteroid isomerase-like protein